MNRLSLAVSLLTTSALGFADTGPVGWIATANRAFIAMPATSITDGAVSRVSWSPDGAYLLVAERPTTVTREQILRFDGSSPVAGPLSLLAWDREFRHVRTLWTTEDPTATIDNVAWLRGTSSALITVRRVVQDTPKSAQRPVFGVMAMDSATRRFQWIPGMEQLPAEPTIVPSPTRPVAAVAFSDEPTNADAQPTPVVGISSDGASGTTWSIPVSIQVITGELQTLGGAYLRVGGAQAPFANNFGTVGASGNVVNLIKVEKAIQLPLVWNQSGSAWFLRGPDPKTQKQTLLRLTAQGSLEATDEAEFVAKQVPPELQVTSAAAVAQMGKSKHGYENLWLKSATPSDNGELLLCADGESPELSPTQDGVFYIDSGVAKVRMLIQLSQDEQKIMRESLKLHALAPPAGAPLEVGSLFFRLLIDSGQATPVRP